MESLVKVSSDKGLPDRAIVNSWVLTQDFVPYIQALRERFPEIPAETNAGIGYVYIDHDAGISMKVECLCTIRSRKDPIAAILPLDDLASLKLRYSALKNLTLYQFSPGQIEDLGLRAIPDWLKFYETPELTLIRELVWLDPFRANGFFDDVMVALPGIGGNVPELLWVRLMRYFKDIDRFHGTLLNEPFRDYGIHRNDIIEVQVARNPEGISLVAIPSRVSIDERTHSNSPDNPSEGGDNL
ncbi:MAG: hypothetical protein NTW33_01560 [Methanoregula sp.]|nr:hypothetical protein [Methanoregula sp.]